MHRVELKGQCSSLWLLNSSTLFLMHRVELKVGLLCIPWFDAWKFLMHRVELKDKLHSAFFVYYFMFLMHRVELKVF